MSLFKTKEEKRIMQQMEAEEANEAFNEHINIMKAKRDEYAQKAAEAELANNQDLYNLCVNNLIDLNEGINSLVQTKANFDIINLSNSIANNMNMAINALSHMADSAAQMPNVRKIQRVNLKVKKYMSQIKVSNKLIGSVMKGANPANKARSESEVNAVRPLIDAARAKINNQNMPKKSMLDLSAEIEAEKNKI